MRRLCRALAAVGSVGALVAHGNSTLPDGVVFILGDHIGYGDLGCYGATKISTPRLDAMAGEGIRFLTRTLRPRRAHRAGSLY
jgi:hypothetical protein